MGLTQSKVEAEPIVFINPNVPVQFTPSFIHSLEKKVEKTEAGQVEALVRERVAEELAKMKQIEGEIKQTLVDENKQTDVIESNSHIETMIKNINRAGAKDLPLEIKEKQEKVVACYKNNKDRSLDCWQEVLNFKQAVLEEQKKFISKTQ
ncbi:hypothetical protein G6F57_004083 [Rhizopus arrhizus]|uniref:MICOS complex subunit mic19 n=1 Tax=Rhizopus oryzae TaxID=64495 RepID=A0A9P7BUS1_RHIOR|nr:hypothetical protein G6F23_002586 [Rhizopus arrhizus]KAG1421287.1 hypothetical protein G6F58_003801 [Rhizopus delemar]KAG0766381.1 hypothetical protein G6F24_003657 [Rhizopus arrhizus]KAG0793501.1 hypothetical protein G6F21_003569 [Rhizopus arrhizus]KAG0819279.1 hypothetical protein G6F20_000900 [Rhizopus arrhizus]